MAIEKPVGVKSGVFTSDIQSTNDFGHVFQSNNIYNRSDIKWYTKYNRFGVLDPYNAVTTTREYLFFVKPDLHICTPGTGVLSLNPELENYPFFIDLWKRYPDIIEQLQFSIYNPKTSKQNVFMTVLSNSVKNTLDLPGITASAIETGANIYGTSIDYRGDGYLNDEKHSFTLEFEDTRYLEIYMLLKAYEEYERLKKFGIVSPPNIGDATVSKSGYAYTDYHRRRELHDQFGIYKFVVDEDFETIIYWAYLCGVYFETVPRDAFSDMKVDGGLRYSVGMKAAFVDDMNPQILRNFNKLIRDNMNVPETQLPIYNETYDSVDGRWATVPYITMKKKSDYKAGVWLGPSNMNYIYKLTWRI